MLSSGDAVSTCPAPCTTTAINTVLIDDKWVGAQQRSSRLDLVFSTRVKAGSRNQDRLQTAKRGSTVTSFTAQLKPKYRRALLSNTTKPLPPKYHPNRNSLDQ